MSEDKRKCRYKCELTEWQCPYEALDDSKDGFCIFHERRKDKDLEKFNEGIKKILENKDSDAYHFEGFYFPNSISFKGVVFKKDVFFSEAEFAGGVTNFCETKFSGERTYFNRVTFSGEDSLFFKALFAGKRASFAGAMFSGQHISFTNTKFLARETTFVAAEFQGKEGSFVFAEFLGKTLNFYHTKFIGRIIFWRTIFTAQAVFEGVDLGECVFARVDLGNVNFVFIEWDWNKRLGNETLLGRGTEFEEDLFELMKPHQWYFETSEIYRQLKVQFHNKRDFAKAGIFHFREQECKRMACKLPQEFFKWIFLWILRLSCGYGEKLRNVGLSSLALVFIFGIIYMFVGLHNTDQNESLLFQYSLKTYSTTSLGTILKDFWTSLIFSVKGFFPLWRFQQYKVVGDFANLLAGFEFLLGAFMVGLFVYVFRRRMDK
jgi:uncharacterized protein YjbI with pentapeptide repeats